MQLIIDTEGAQVLLKDGAFLIRDGKGGKAISPAELDSIAITAGVMISSDAIALAIQHDVPILLFGHISKAQTRLWKPCFERIAALRRHQARFFESAEAMVWLLDLLAYRTQAQIENLKYLQKGGSRLTLVQPIRQLRRKSRALEQFRRKPPKECRQQLMEIENSLTRIYRQAQGRALLHRYTFLGCRRYPAKDVFSAGVNYLYDLLYAVVEGALYAVGLNPHLDILQVGGYKASSLSSGLAEPFLPRAGRLMIGLCLDKELPASFFSENQHGIHLTGKGKVLIALVFRNFLRRKITFLQQEASVKNHIYFAAARLAQQVWAQNETQR